MERYAEEAAGASKDRDHLIVLALVDTSDVLYRAFHSRRDYLAEAAGSHTTFLLHGDPRHSDTRFLNAMERLGAPLADLRADWEKRVDGVGDPDTARRTASFLAATCLGVEDEELPCLVISTARNAPETRRLHLPGAWWATDQQAQVLVRRLEELLSSDVVGQGGSLEFVARVMRSVQDGLSLADALGIDRDGEKIIRIACREHPDRVPLSTLTARLSKNDSQIYRAQKKLVQLGLLHNKPRIGCRATDLALWMLGFSDS